MENFPKIVKHKNSNKYRKLKSRSRNGNTGKSIYNLEESKDPTKTPVYRPISDLRTRDFECRSRNDKRGPAASDINLRGDVHKGEVDRAGQKSVKYDLQDSSYDGRSSLNRRKVNQNSSFEIRQGAKKDLVDETAQKLRDLTYKSKHGKLSPIYHATAKSRKQGYLGDARSAMHIVDASERSDLARAEDSLLASSNELHIGLEKLLGSLTTIKWKIGGHRKTISLAELAFGEYKFLCKLNKYMEKVVNGKNESFVNALESTLTKYFKSLKVLTGLLDKIILESSQLEFNTLNANVCSNTLVNNYDLSKYIKFGLEAEFGGLGSIGTTPHGLNTSRALQTIHNEFWGSENNVYIGNWIIELEANAQCEVVTPLLLIPRESNFCNLGALTDVGYHLLMLLNLSWSALLRNKCCNDQTDEEESESCKNFEHVKSYIETIGSVKMLEKKGYSEYTSNKITWQTAWGAKDANWAAADLGAFLDATNATRNKTTGALRARVHPYDKKSTESNAAYWLEKKRLDLDSAGLGIKGDVDEAYMEQIKVMDDAEYNEHVKVAFGRNEKKTLLNELTTYNKTTDKNGTVTRLPKRTRVRNLRYSTQKTHLYGGQLNVSTPVNKIIKLYEGFDLTAWSLYEPKHLKILKECILPKPWVSKLRSDQAETVEWYTDMIAVKLIELPYEAYMLAYNKKYRLQGAPQQLEINASSIADLGIISHIKSTWNDIILKTSLEGLFCGLIIYLMNSGDDACLTLETKLVIEPRINAAFNVDQSKIRNPIIDVISENYSDKSSIYKKLNAYAGKQGHGLFEISEAEINQEMLLLVDGCQHRLNEIVKLMTAEKSAISLDHGENKDFGVAWSKNRIYLVTNFINEHGRIYKEEILADKPPYSLDDSGYGFYRHMIMARNDVFLNMVYENDSVEYVLEYKSIESMPPK